MTENENINTNENVGGITVEGDGYTYQFSRGLLAHSLGLRGLPLEEAYKVAKKVYSVLLREGIDEINENDLRRYVRDQALELVGKNIAIQYNIIEKWHLSNFPLILLIAGARGCKTGSVAKSLAEKLAFPRIVSTDIVTQIMRRMMSHDLSPELHEKSYLAWKKLRPIYSVLYDKVLIGFEEHSKYPAEAVEALVKRALLEGISMVIHGEHLVPRFLSEDLISHPSVIYVTLEVKDEELHRQNYIKQGSKSNYDERKENFESIRKIHDYLVEESKNRHKIVIEFESVNETIEKIYEIILKRLSKAVTAKSYTEYTNMDPIALNS